MLVNGDCTVIKTPSGKTVVIDTGEQEKTIVEYLLDRKIKKVDYLMISHFDSDHCGKAVEIIENLKVKNIIISKQAEWSQEFEDIIKIAQKCKVNIIEVQAGDKLKIDRYVYFSILWPISNEFIKENPLNNNSIVAKMNYKSFSILFTGDIEEAAEKKILSIYNEEILSATAIKVAHHGSKTSSIEEMIETVKSKISLIGVGRNNKFGHPNDQIIERLSLYGNKIYRTDLCGEVTLIVNKKGKIKVKTMLK